MDIWQVKYIRIGDLIPNAKNPRKISKEKLERLQDKIQRLGFHNPVKTDENLNVLGGNQRLKALLKIAGAVGEIFMTLTNICITQNQTQKTKGGMTEVYLNSGTYLKSFYSVMFAPSAVQIAVMGDKEKRIHHRVNWKFAAPLIIRESLKK